jgi:excisionase family DNA binding protein
MSGLARKDLRLLTTREAARRLRVSEATVYRYVRSGRVPAVRLAEFGPWRIPAADLEALLRPSRAAAEETS